MDIGVPELLIILLIVVVLFGPGRLSKTMGELGDGLRAFKEGLQGEPKDTNKKEGDLPKSTTDTPK